MSKPVVDKRFIVNLKGKEFVTYEGLLDTGHQIGIKSIETELLQVPSESNHYVAIAKARITTEDDKIYEEIGDAGPKSVNRMIQPHIIRMAFTRAKARALRDLTNIGMTAIEELGGDEEEAKPQATPKPRPTPYNTNQEYKCSKCGVNIKNNVYTYSTRKYGTSLCFDCQKVQEANK